MNVFRWIGVLALLCTAAVAHGIGLALSWLGDKAEAAAEVLVWWSAAVTP